MKSCLDTVAKSLSQMKENLYTQRQMMIPSILCFVVIIVDPLFFYIPVINDEKKCITVDRNLAIIGSVLLRSFCDFWYLIGVTIPQWGRCPNCFRRNRFLTWNCLLVFSNLPLPQGMVISLLIPQKSTLGILSAAAIILFQSQLRTYVISSHLNDFVNYFEKGRLFYLVYPWTAYVYGTVWYLLAILKEVICWNKACKMLTGCDNLFRFCDESLRPYEGNTSSCNFGTSNEIIHYHITEVKDFPRKILFCIRWGLQSISSFGQNLQTDGDFLDNLLVISSSIFSVILFVTLFERTQRYKQSVAAVVERRKLMVQQYNCMLFRNLSENLQQQVEEYKRSIWKENKGVSAKGIDAVDFLCDLSEDLKRKIKRELCLESLKKVKEFGWWSEAMVDELCDCVKPVSYTEHTHIVMEGDKIDEILFLVQGKVRTYLFRNVKAGPAAGSSRRRTVINHLRDSDRFFGEELVAWFQADPYSSDLPISNKTVSVLTEAVGFALMSADLKSILIKNHAALFLQLFWRFKTMKKHQAAQKQTPPSHQPQQMAFEISIQEP